MEKTKKLKEIIINKYGSIREFAKVVEIPSTTLVSGLDKGIGGMAVDRVIKICEILNIDVKTFEPIKEANQEISLKEVLPEDEKQLLDNYNKLNDFGKEKLIDYSNDLIGNARYTYTAPITIAAHDDDLTEDEKAEMDRRIAEFEKNLK